MEERLTKREQKHIELPNEATIDKVSYDCDVFNRPMAIAKLGKLEDIEERWNISIEIVDKAINDGIYIRNNVNHDIILVYPSFSIGRITKKYYFEYDYFIFKEETYGQDWALTKEELL